MRTPMNPNPKCRGMWVQRAAAGPRLNKRTTSEGLKEAFLKFGQVIEARVITDRISGYSRGFGFVKYATVQEAGEAIKGMDGKVTAFFGHCVARSLHCRNAMRSWLLPAVWGLFGCNLGLEAAGQGG
ncbi:unnamed protein product [Miscanthus lutarioriparius]|uniref:RRM domain-containing protein n=1 Tax=Miscanthus lutarioriparius TaxID=422564 RepID=A0A811N7I2_9POAL|nr:unnamed protein product [Miscanthus lutarioriparius]